MTKIISISGGIYVASFSELWVFTKYDIQIESIGNENKPGPAQVGAISKAQK